MALCDVKDEDPKGKVNVLSQINTQKQVCVYVSAGSMEVLVAIVRAQSLTKEKN